VPSNLTRLSFAADADVEIRIVPFAGQYAHSMTYRAIGLKITNAVTNDVANFDVAMARTQWCSNFIDNGACRSLPEGGSTVSVSEAERTSFSMVSSGTTAQVDDTAITNDATEKMSKIWDGLFVILLVCVI